jgi:hypothetical protein
MKLSVDFKELDEQLRRMGASLSDWGINSSSLDPRQQLLIELNKGIEIDLADVEVGAGQLLTYKGEQVILYIKDTGSSISTLKNEPENSKRFHISDCQTLSKMRRVGRYERYVVTNRTDGLFLADWIDHESNQRGETEAALKVCMFCLGTVNWQGYESGQRTKKTKRSKQQFRESIWTDFSISEFLMSYSTFFHSKPSRRDVTAELNKYVPNWHEISERKRKQRNWKCEACSVNLSNLRGSLHCHHISGVVTDNSDKNLMVLCAICHSEQPFHKRMGVPEKVKRQINSLRIEQGLMPS